MVIQNLLSSHLLQRQRTKIHKCCAYSVYFFVVSSLGLQSDKCPSSPRCSTAAKCFHVRSCSDLHSPDNMQPPLGCDHFTGLLCVYICMDPGLHNNSNETSTSQQLKGKKEMTVLRRTIQMGHTLSSLCVTQNKRTARKWEHNVKESIKIP